MPEKNPITPIGIQNLQEEYRELKHKERPQVVDTVAWAASNGDRSENADYHYGKKRLREIDRRLGYIGKRLDNAEVIDPTKIKSEMVQFGATVTVLTEDDEKKVYSIVGDDESDANVGKICWRSPIAKSLLKAKVDDVVVCKTPQGEKELEIVKIEYKQIL